MGSNTEIDKDNIIPATYEHLPEDVCLMLEERKKKRDEEDLLAVLASIKVVRRGKVTKVKEINFASTSTDASTGVTMEQIQKLLAEHDVYWVNWLSSKERESAGKKPEMAYKSTSIWDADELFQWSNCDTHVHRSHYEYPGFGQH